MPIAYHVDTDRGLLISVWLGAVTLAEISAHLDTIAADPLWPATRKLLTDLRRVPASHRPNAEQLDAAAGAFAERLGMHSNAVRWAIVAGNLFARAVAFDELVRENVRRLFVFQDLGTACAWMDLDPDEVDAVISGLSRGTSRAAH